MSLLNEFKLLADYNQLMNRRFYAASAQLSEQQLNDDRGAFFGSVLATLNHIVVGDVIWLKRFATHPGSADVLLPVTDMRKPERLDSILFVDFAELSAEHRKLDLLVKVWVENLKEVDLDDRLAYHDTQGNSHEKPYGSLINHLFLHQTHHRGQVSTLLSQFGVDFAP